MVRLQDMALMLANAKLEVTVNSASTLAESYDPLNPDETFFDNDYVAPKIVNLAHEAMTLRTTNVFVWPDEQTEAWIPYYMGLIGVPALIFALFATILISLCVQACCRCPGCRKANLCSCSQNRTNRLIGFGTFALCAVISIISWGETFVINIDMNGALDWTTRVLLEEAQSFYRGADILTEASEVIDALTNWTAPNNTAHGCSGPLHDVLTKNYQVLESAEKHLQAASNDLRYIGDTLYHSHDVFQDISSIRRVVLNVWSSIMLVVSVLFLSSVSITFWLKPTPGNEKYLRALRNTSCISLYSLAILFICVAFLVAMVFWPLSTVGADICAPGPSNTANRVIAETTGSSQLIIEKTNGTCFPSEPDDEIELITNEQWLLCYYQSCVANFSDHLNVASRAALTLEQVQERLKDSIANDKPSNHMPSSCDDIIEEIEGKILPVLTKLSWSFVEIFSCVRLHNVYIALVEKTFCDGLVSAFIHAWRYSFLGAFTLLVAILIFQIFDLATHRDFNFAADKGVDILTPDGKLNEDAEPALDKCNFSADENHL